MLRTRVAYAPVIRAAADPGGRALDLSEFGAAVLVAIAWHQPISRELSATGPREPRRGAPYNFVTTETFLAAFGMETLRDLADT